MNIFERKFTTGQLCAVTGITNANLQNWLKRGIIVGHGIEGGGSPGKHRQFTFFNLMEIAIAKEGLDSGLQLEHAFRAGRLFAHFGDGPLGDIHPERLPGLPFWGGGKSMRTLMAVRGERTVIVPYQVGKDPLPSIWHELGEINGFVLIDAEGVFERIVATLHYAPGDVMRWAYGERAD